MKYYESIIIGHITMDINTDCDGNTVSHAGGAVLFSSAAAFGLGHKTAAVTKTAVCDKDRLAAFTIPGEDIFLLDSEKSTNMKNSYFTADRERRISVCSEHGDCFKPDELPVDISAPVYHLAGLVNGDFSDDMIPELSKKGDLAVDVQGYLRHVDWENGGRLVFKDWDKKKEFLPYIRFLKTDAAEAEILTGTADRTQAAALLYKWGAREILITHNTEVLAYDGKDFHTCPIRSRNLSGRTGRGDTTFAAYINERGSHCVKDALLTAAATVSLKMETPGPFKGTRADVEDYITRFYQ